MIEQATGDDLAADAREGYKTFWSSKLKNFQICLNDTFDTCDIQHLLEI